MKPIRWESEAVDEFTRALGASTRPADFRKDVDAAAAMLSRNPRMGAKVSRSRYRQLILDRLPYSVIYEDEPALIRIIAFAHHKRRPGYWKKRKPSRDD